MSFTSTLFACFRSLAVSESGAASVVFVSTCALLAVLLGFDTSTAGASGVFGCVLSMHSQSGPCVLPMHSQSGPFFDTNDVFGCVLPMHSQSGPCVLPMHSQSGPFFDTNDVFGCVLPMH